MTRTPKSDTLSASELGGESTGASPPAETPPIGAPPVESRPADSNDHETRPDQSRGGAVPDPVTKSEAEGVADPDLSKGEPAQDDDPMPGDDEGFAFQEQVNEAFRRTHGRLPDPRAAEASDLSEDTFEEEIARASALLAAGNTLVIHGETYVRDFANLLLSEHSRGRTIVRRLESHQRLLRSRDHLTELERLIAADSLDGQIVELDLSLPSNEDFAAGLWREGGFDRLKDSVAASGGTLVVVVDQVRRTSAGDLTDLLDGEQSIRVPWLRIQLMKWQLQLDLNDEELEEVRQEIERRIERSPNQELRIAYDLQRLQASLGGASGGQTYLLERIKELFGGNKRAEESSLVALLEHGWQRRLRRVLLGLYTVLSESVDGAAYRSVRELGRRILAGVQIPVPIELEEVLEEGRGGDTSSRMSRRFEEVDAAGVWMEEFDGLLRDCGLSTARTELGRLIRADVFRWDDHWLREEFGTRYPGAIEEVVNRVRGATLLFPRDGQGIPLAISAARLLVAECRREPTSYPLDAVASQLVADALTIAGDRTEAAELELVAVGLALFLREMWNSSDAMDEQETREILANLMREGVLDVDRAQLLAHAFAMLTQDDDFPAEQYLFEILERIGTSADKGLLKVWKVVRQGFIGRMRRSHEDRLRVLFELHDRELAAEQTVPSRSIMLARLWYDGIRADFLRRDLPFEQTFSRALLESDEAASKIVAAFWASDPDMIAVTRNPDDVRPDIARMLLDGIDFERLYAPSLVVEKLSSDLRETIGRGYGEQVVAALRRVHDAVENMRRRTGPLAAWMHVQQLSETEEHRELLKRMLQPYHHYRSVALAEWLIRAEAEVDQSDGDTGEVNQRFLRVFQGALPPEDRRAVGRDWLTASRWLRDLEDGLSAFDTATVEIKEQYQYLKSCLRRKRHRLRTLARACRESTA